MRSKPKSKKKARQKHLDYIKSKIRIVPHWPKRGVMFRDITTLVKDHTAFAKTINLLVKKYKGVKIDLVAGIESRGFIIGSILAHRLKKGFVMIRKPGKLPAKTVSEEYELEYGKNKIEVHADAIEKGDKVLIVDDLLATGGTMRAACRLVEKLGGKVVGCAFVVELPELQGSKKLKKYPIYKLVDFEGE